MNTHLLILILSVVVASFSQILLKKSAQKTYRSIIYEYLNPYVICGYGMMFLSMFLTIIAYSGMDFTNVQIVEATGYIMVLILSYFFFHEKITRRKVLGMALIFAGIAVYYLRCALLAFSASRTVMGSSSEFSACSSRYHLLYLYIR